MAVVVVATVAHGDPRTACPAEKPRHPPGCPERTVAFCIAAVGENHLLQIPFYKRRPQGIQGLLQTGDHRHQRGDAHVAEEFASQLQCEGKVRLCGEETGGCPS